MNHESSRHALDTAFISRFTASDSLRNDPRYRPQQKNTFANIGYSLKGDLNAWLQENIKVLC